MSEMDFETSVAEVVGMVSKAHQNKPRPWGVIVPGDQLQHLLELEASRNKLEAEVERRKRQLARVENLAQETVAVQARAVKLARVAGTGVRVMLPLMYMLGAMRGLMDPLFAWALGVPCIIWAVCHWMGK